MWGAPIFLRFCHHATPISDHPLTGRRGIFQGFGGVESRNTLIQVQQNHGTAKQSPSRKTNHNKRRNNNTNNTNKHSQALRNNNSAKKKNNTNNNNGQHTDERLQTLTNIKHTSKQHQKQTTSTQPGAKPILRAALPTRRGSEGAQDPGNFIGGVCEDRTCRGKICGE